MSLTRTGSCTRYSKQVLDPSADRLPRATLIYSDCGRVRASVVNNLAGYGRRRRSETAAMTTTTTVGNAPRLAVQSVRASRSPALLLRLVRRIAGGRP